MGVEEVEAPGWAAGAWASGVEVWLLGLAVAGVVPCGSVAGVVCAMAVATKNTNAVTIDNDSFFIFFFSPESKYVKKIPELDLLRQRSIYASCCWPEATTWMGGR
jgi:hypothetical protein